MSNQLKQLYKHSAKVQGLVRGSFLSAIAKKIQTIALLYLVMSVPMLQFFIVETIGKPILTFKTSLTLII